MTVKDLQSTVDYSFGVFTLSQYGNYGEPVTISYRYDFPSEPTDYLDCAEISHTTEYEVPENGYFRIDVIGAGGKGGSELSTKSGSTAIASAGGGGTGGYARSEVKLYKGDIISISFSDTLTVSSSKYGINIQVTHGGIGGNAIDYCNAGSGGYAGHATGGNKLNQSGRSGSKGNTQSSRRSISGGAGASYQTLVITNTKTYNIYGGNGAGADDIISSSYHVILATNGNNAMVFISRGNTNIPSPQ